MRFLSGGSRTTIPRVRIISTAADDLRGIWRLRRQPAARGPSGGTKARAEALPDATWQARYTDEGGTTSEFDLYATRYEKAVDQAISFTGRDSDFSQNGRPTSLRR